MTHQMPAHIAGEPQFDDAELQQLAQTQGLEAAWRACFSRGDAATQLTRVHGPFAVAMKLEDGRCVLAVDRFSVHTLCYRNTARSLSWSPKAAALASPIDALSEQALFEYLFFHCIPSPRTVFAEVSRLPPAHVAELSQGQLRVRPYWTPEFRVDPKTSFHDWKLRFRSALLAGVRAGLGNSRPACFLSGGTDSSTVAGMIREATGGPAATYSIGFDAQGYDEMAYARLAAKHFGAEHHEYYVTPADLVAGIPLLAASHDQPFGNSSALPAYYCALRAREDGVQTLLAGDGGDELFGGNARYAKQRVFGWYGLLPNVVRSRFMEPVFGSAMVSSLPLLKKGSSYVAQARVPMPDRLHLYNLLVHLGQHNVLTDEFLARIDLQGPTRDQRAVYAAPHASAEIDRMLAFDWRYTLAESDLPKVRGSAELAGVAVRFPMLDPALLDIALELPPQYKLRGLKLRWFFKEALRGFLPDEILTKKKQGFGLPFGVWAVQNPALNALASDSVRGLVPRGIVRESFVRELLEQRLPQFPGYYGEMVWILMMLEQWFRRHVPGFRLGAAARS